MYIDYFNSPIGLMECKASDKGLVHVIFCGERANDESDKADSVIKHKVNTNHLTYKCIKQLDEYFSGVRSIFDIAFDPKGTDFQQQVWACLSTIPYGKTASYGDIAKMVGKPKGAQAVGGANGRNPLTIVVPCHRVVGGNGALTGYAGGIERKLWLLNHEGISANQLKHPDNLDLGLVITKRQAKTEFLT